MPSLDSLNSRRTLDVDGKTYHYFSLPEAAKSLGSIDKLPLSLKVLLENLLRWEDGKTVTRDDLDALVAWQKERRSDREIQYRPARVLMQDFTGVPAVVDLAAMRDAVASAVPSGSALVHTVCARNSRLTWWQMPVPGGTTRKLSNAIAPQRRN